MAARADVISGRMAVVQNYDPFNSSSMRIRKTLFFGLLAGCALLAYAQEQLMAAQQPTLNPLMPIPAEIEFRAGRLPLNAKFRIAVIGPKDNRLQAAVARARKRVEIRTGLKLKSRAAGEIVEATLLINCKAPAQTYPILGEDETYSLIVSPRQAVLSAETALGALRGLETFLQLIEKDQRSYFLPAVAIKDKPRFPWRGLLIDVCRHWQPLAVIKRNLDGMAAVKLNVLHWHLTEDQGFRIESRKYPKLHEMGADGLYYTQEQVREVITYAADRGIRVVPEFDMPGHVTSWLVGHPELASAPGPYQIERRFGIIDAALDPTREEVYTFLDGFFGEMAALFPDAYMHIGGDETNGKQWSRNPRIQLYMREKALRDSHALQGYFNRRLSDILRKFGKRMIGWDEILHPDLPQTTVVQSWRGQKSLVTAAKRGYAGLLSFGYYLDHLRPASYHYGIDPIAKPTDLDDRLAAQVLGGEACMWSEYANHETIDSRIWPRLAAIAERLWSPSHVTDTDDMYRRLAGISPQLAELGLTHQKHKERMLERLAGHAAVGPMKTLIDVVEPVKVYQRGRLQPTTQSSPLTRLVDVACPDSDVARDFAQMVDGLLKDAPKYRVNRPRIEDRLAAWRDLRSALERAPAKTPLLEEAEPWAQELSALGCAGLEALAYLTDGTSPTDAWRKKNLALLTQAATPKAAVELAILSPLRQLITAALK